MVFQGDILVSPEELKEMMTGLDLSTDGEARNKRRAQQMGSGMQPTRTLTPSDGKTPSDSKAIVSRVWPNCEVPYKFDQTLCKCKIPV